MANNTWYVTARVYKFPHAIIEQNLILPLVHIYQYQPSIHGGRVYIYLIIPLRNDSDRPWYWQLCRTDSDMVPMAMVLAVVYAVRERERRGGFDNTTHDPKHNSHTSVESFEYSNVKG